MVLAEHLLAGLVLAAAAAIPAPVLGQKEPLAEANAALQAGEADKALAFLDKPGNRAEAYNLRCRVEYTLKQWDRAANDC